MSQRRGWTGVAVSAVVFVVCVALAVTSVFVSGDVAEAVAGEPPGDWRVGAPAADLAVLPPAAAEPPTPEGAVLQRSLDALGGEAALGPSVNAVVLDAVTGKQLAARGAGTPTIPASTIKLVTAAAALTVLGPTHRFTTKVVQGANPGEVILVGGGDPTLTAGTGAVFPAGAASLVDLAEQVKRALGGAAPSQVTVDASVFAAPPFGPWDSDIPTNGVVSQIVGLTADGGRVDTSRYKGSTARVAEPDLAAGQAFAALLGVGRKPVRGTAPAGARELGGVLSLPVERQVEIMLTESDNVIAESLARHVAIKKGKPATFEGGAAALTEVMGALGLPVTGMQQFDGSGLARVNKVPPAVLAGIVQLATKPDRPELRPIITGMPVSAYSGTLAGRFRKGPQTAPGVVRAKTGTLRSVSSIAGVVTTADGRQLVFAVLADNVPVGGTGPAQDALDKVVAAIAACGCR